MFYWLRFIWSRKLSPIRRLRAVCLAALIAATVLAPRACASSAYLTLDTGLTAFKWGAYETGLGFPHFDSPKWDLEPGLEWAPSFLERQGLWLRVSFPWQALGRSSTFFHDGQTYVDGPRFGIRWRGKLVPLGHAGN